MQPDAVATVGLAEGITLDWVVVGDELELELEELELELEEPPDWAMGRHGGTISVVTLLLAGSTSWFCGWAPEVEVLLAPPGVMRIVLAGGGAMVGLLELELLELLLELLELLEVGEPQGSMATVWVRLLRGMTIWLEPGGIVLVPDCPTTAASEHEVTAMVRGVCCWGITTVLTPGLIKAAVTGSWLELEELLLLLPHAASPTAAVPIARTATQRRDDVRTFMLSSEPL